MSFAQVLPRAGCVRPARPLAANSGEEPRAPLTPSELLDDDVARMLPWVVMAGVVLGVGGRRVAVRKILISVDAASPA